jgi:dihydroorotate dehydrogenase
MLPLPYALTRPFLFGLDPEQAHDLTLDSLARLQNTPAMCLWSQPRVDDPVTLAGLRFRTASAWPPAWTRTAAASTVWARWASVSSRSARSRRSAQPGNPKPRMFRLPAAEALINRLGFNNEGLEAFVANVQRAYAASAPAAASWG